MLLSLDAGFAKTGWSLWEKGILLKVGILITTKTQRKSTRVADDHAARSIVLATGLQAIIVNNSVDGIIAELPSGGAQSAKAMAFMNSAISIVATVGALNELPMEWCTPGDVKKAVGGKLTTSKDEIMDWACKGWGFFRDKRKGFFHEMFGPWPKTQFEDIADSIAVYKALSNDNLVKIYG